MSMPGLRRRQEIIVWIWLHLPVGGAVKSVIAWLANLRYAVGVAAIILDQDGRVLIVRHTYRRAGHEWGLPGGWVHGRESLEHGLKRELLEETGFTIAIDGLVAVHSGFALPRLTVFYLAHLQAGRFTPSAEVSAYEFRAPGDLSTILRGESFAVSMALKTHQSQRS